MEHPSHHQYTRMKYVSYYTIPIDFELCRQDFWPIISCFYFILFVKGSLIVFQLHLSKQVPIGSSIRFKNCVYILTVLHYILQLGFHAALCIAN